MYSLNIAVSRSANKKADIKQEESKSDSDGTMCVLMGTAKMIFRFAESKISKHEQFHKLSGPRMGVLFAVNEAGRMRMGDLAAKLHVAPRTVTDLIDGLERDGFIRRLPDPSDRRASLLELTPQTQADFGEITLLRKAFVEEIFSALTPDEQSQLRELLTKLQNGPLSKLLGDEKLPECRVPPNVE